MAVEERAPASARERIVLAALGLLEAGGREAVSTRAVAAAAGVQAPTIYRLFGDKDGLLDAVAALGFERYLARKAPVRADEDAVEGLRAGWDLHVALGLEAPALYGLMYDRAAAGLASEAARRGFAALDERMRAVAAAGRLRMGVRRAAQLMHAAGLGTTLSLIATPPEERDPELSATAREAVIAAITTPQAAAPDAPAGPRAAAVALRAAVEDLEALSPSERALMAEWLDRVAAGPAPG